MIYSYLKRLSDLILATLLFIFFFPFLLTIPVFIKLQSPGPVLFKQRRVGKDNKDFMMYKFRTMYQNADEMLLKDENLKKRFKNEKGGWKIPANEDPRITPIGKFVRKFTLDEIPQLINVFKGEMSIVGPRPYRRDHVGDEISEQLKKFPHLSKEIKLLLSVKPGITGPWQTSGRNDISWDQQVKLGAEYAHRKSLLNDLYIVIKTPFAMLSKW